MKKESVHDLPKGIRNITLATSLRYFGWGFVEALIPIFLFQFSHSYAEAGLLSAIYSIILLLTLPLAGRLADKISAKTILIIGICFYPFLALSYFIAGITGLAVFIVIARFLNGIGYAFDSVGRNTYFRKHSDHKKLSSLRGYFDTYTNLWWLIGVAFSFFLVKFIPINYLFLAIIPTSLLTLGMFIHLRKDCNGELVKNIDAINPERAYLGSFKEIKSWNIELKLIAFISFFVSVVSSIISFFIPIYAYTQNASLSQIVLITIVLTIPYLFSNILGKIADKKRESLLYVGLIALFLILSIIIFFENYYMYLIAAFVMGIIFELISLINYELSTLLSKKNHYGRLSGIMGSLSESGLVIGPIILGLLIDKFGISSTLAICSISTLVLFLLIFIGRKRFFKRKF